MLVQLFIVSVHAHLSLTSALPLVLASTLFSAWPHFLHLHTQLIGVVASALGALAYLGMLLGTSPELRLSAAVSAAPLLLSSALLARFAALLYGAAASSLAPHFADLPFLPLPQLPLNSELFFTSLAPIAVILSILSVWTELALSLYEIATSRAEAMHLADVARQVASRLPPELVSRIMKPALEENSGEEDSEPNLEGWKQYSSLVDEVAHQARTYETNSTGFIQMLLDTNITANQEELILNLQQSLAYSSRLLQCAILFFKADAGLLSLDLSTSFDCQQIFDFALSEISANLEDNMNINVVRRVDPDFPYLLGDTTYIMTMLKMLLDNAAKYTLQGSITLSARVLERSWATRNGTNAEFALVEFGVSDTGCGIPAAQLPLIKTPFATKDELFWSPQMTKGAGLGVPTADSLARCFPEGRLHVESTENVGTSVTARFRLMIDSQRSPELLGLDHPALTSAPALLNQMTSPSSSERRASKIAVFAPEPTFASLAGMLTPHGFQVKHFVSRGTSSIDLAFEIRQALLQRDPFKAVLIDAHAYGSSHHHLERIFALASGIKNDPINATTPLALVIHAGLFAGKIARDASVFDECILKPLLCQQVLLSMQRLLNGYGEAPTIDPRFITSGDAEAEDSYEADESSHAASEAMPSSPSATSLNPAAEAGLNDSGYGLGIPDSNSMSRLRRHSLDATLTYNQLMSLETTRNSIDGAESTSTCSNHSTLGDLPEGSESDESSPRNAASSDTATDSTSGRSTGEVPRLDTSSPTLPNIPPGRLSRRSRTTVDSSTISAYQSWKEKSTARSPIDNPNHPISLSASATVSSTNVLPLTVLIIEDDKTNRLVLSKMVSHLDHKSITAENGPEGLDIFRRHYATIDLVIMDYRMPKMDGAQTTQAIRAFEAELETEAVPIIGLSADDSVRPKCIAAGMDNCWTKPLKAQTLQVYLVQRRMAKMSKPTRTSLSSSSIPLPRSSSSEGPLPRAMSHAGIESSDSITVAAYSNGSAPPGRLSPRHVHVSRPLEIVSSSSAPDTSMALHSLPNGDSKHVEEVEKTSHPFSNGVIHTPLPGSATTHLILPPADAPRTTLLPPKKSSLRNLAALAAQSVQNQSSAPNSPGRASPLGPRVQSALGTSANTLLPTPSLIAKKNGAVLLPIARSASHSNTTSLSSSASSPEISDGDRILLVEDNLTVAKIAMTVLARNQQPVELATDGQEAFERISRDHSIFCVVLMDIHLPRMNGFDATRAIRTFEKDNNLAPLFIIALTGEMRFIDPEPYLSCGFNHFLRKPVNYQVLIAQLPQFRAHRAHLANPTANPPGEFAPSLTPSTLIASSSTFDTSAPGKREADSPELATTQHALASSSDALPRRAATPFSSPSTSHSDPSPSLDLNSSKSHNQPHQSRHLN